VAGMVMGGLWLKGKVPRPATGFVLIALALSGFTLIQVAGLPFDALICGPLAAALVAGVLALEAVQAIRVVPAAVFLGDASYAIYLWHTFAIWVVAKIGASTGVSSLVVFVAALLAGVFAGTLAYYLLEKQGLVTAWRISRDWFARPASRSYEK